MPRSSKPRFSTRRQQSNSYSYSRFEDRKMLASFTGTTGNDFVAINIGTDTAEVIVNDVSIAVVAPDVIDVDGFAGFNGISITRPAGVEAVFEDGVLEIGGFSISLQNFNTLDIPDGLTVAGTDGDDLFEYFYTGLNLNGSPLGLPSFANPVAIATDGGTGLDQVVIDSEIAGTPGLFTVADYGRFSWTNVEEVQVIQVGSSFGSSVELRGTDGDDVVDYSGFRIELTPSQGPRLTLSVGDSNEVHVVAGGGNDIATLTGAGQIDSFEGSPTSSAYHTDGSFGRWSVFAEGFDRVIAIGTGPSGPTYRSNATITGSADGNSAKFLDDNIGLSSDSWSIEVSGFQNTNVSGGGGDYAIETSNYRVDVGYGISPTLDLTRIGFASQDITFSDFGSIGFVGETIPSVVNNTPNASFVLDHTTSTPTLRRSDISTEIFSEAGFRILGASTNETISIIAPPAEAVTIHAVTPDLVEFETANSLTLLNSFALVHVEGHNDDGEITIDGIGDRTNEERLTFDGSTILLDPLRGMSISTDQFTNSTVLANLGFNDTAILTGSSSGANSFVGTITEDTDTSIATITTPEQAVTLVGFDVVEAIAATENDVALVNGGDLDGSAVIRENGFEFEAENAATSGEVNKSIIGSGFLQVDIDAGGGVNTIEVEHAFNVSLPEQGIGLHATSAFRDPAYVLSNVRDVTFIADATPEVWAIGTDVDLVLDYSVETPSLSRTDNPTPVLSENDFVVRGTSTDNDHLLIVAPQQENGTLSFNQFLAQSANPNWNFVERITVQGHEDNGEITIQGHNSGGTDRLNFNGTDAVLSTAIGISLAATEFGTLNVNARAGGDRAFLSGAQEGGNTFIGDSTSGTLSTPTRTITTTGFDLVAATATGTNNQATLSGTNGFEQLFASPSSARLVGSDFVLNATGFGAVTTEGNAGDFANITDSPGDDVFTADRSPAIAKVEFDGGGSITATNYSTVRAVSSTGDDEAFLEGTSSDDIFIAGADRFGKLSGTGYSFVAVSFPTVLADGRFGNDTAFLNDSAGNDSFIASQTTSRLTGNGFEHSTTNFASVNGLASTGNDTAEFQGSQNDESFFANPTVASLTADNFFAFASGFDSVRANSGGGDDSATLRDSDGDDIFSSNADSATLQGTGFLNEAFGFARVRAISISGSDQAFFQGSSSADNFVGSSGFSYLEGAGFRNQANGFDDVFASGLAGSDTASLFDSQENDSFVGRNNLAQMMGDAYLIQLLDFDEVGLFGFNGGENTLNNDDPDFELNVFGPWI